MKLQLINDDECEVKTIDLPQEILEALWDNKTELVTQYIGWDTRWGKLSYSPEPKTLMRDEKGSGRAAGNLNVTLTKDISATTTLDDFLPSMTWRERREKGMTN